MNEEIITHLEATNPGYKRMSRSDQCMMVIAEGDRRDREEQQEKLTLEHDQQLTHMETVNALDEIVRQLGSQPIYHLLDAVRSLCARRADFYHAEGHVQLRNRWEAAQEIVNSVCKQVLHTELR